MRLPTVTNRTLVIVTGAVALVVVATIFIKKSVHHNHKPLAPLPLTLTAENVPNTAAQTPPKPKDAATTVLELFNPSDRALTKQLNETNVSQAIEHLIATNFVLANCNLITNDDYKHTYFAAIAYAQQNGLGTDKRSATFKVDAIAKSAAASYGMLYSRTKCDDPKLPTILQQLKTWQNAYLPNDRRVARLDPD